jgi:hypothetical protein
VTSALDHEGAGEVGSGGVADLEPEPKNRGLTFRTAWAAGRGGPRRRLLLARQRLREV